MADLLPQGHHLGVVDATKLAHALIAFSIEVGEPARWFEPERADGECSSATYDFCHFANQRYDLRLERHQYYFKASAWTPQSDRVPAGCRSWTWRLAQRDRDRYPHYAPGSYSDHWVAQLGYLMIDWTARQFNSMAPWPAMWIDDPRENEE